MPRLFLNTLFYFALFFHNFLSKLKTFTQTHPINVTLIVLHKIKYKKIKLVKQVVVVRSHQSICQNDLIKEIWTMTLWNIPPTFWIVIIKGKLLQQDKIFVLLSISFLIILQSWRWKSIRYWVPIKLAFYIIKKQQLPR